MNISATLRALYAQKEKLERVIAAFEELRLAAGPEGDPAPDQARGSGRRGRTSMGPEERQRVAERMKAYWAARRNGLPPVQNAGQPSPTERTVSGS